MHKIQVTKCRNDIKYYQAVEESFGMIWKSPIEWKLLRDDLRGLLDRESPTP